MFSILSRIITVPLFWLRSQLLYLMRLQWMWQPELLFGLESQVLLTTVRPQEPRAKSQQHVSTACFPAQPSSDGTRCDPTISSSQSTVIASLRINYFYHHIRDNWACFLVLGGWPAKTGHEWNSSGTGLTSHFNSCPLKSERKSSSSYTLGNVIGSGQSLFHSHFCMWPEEGRITIKYSF